MEPLYTCSVCREDFQFKNIRYSPDGKKIVCTECYNRGLRSAKSQKTAANPLPETIKLMCVDCRYKFIWRPASPIKLMCPYCGKNRLIKDEITAEKLIKEVSEMGREY